MKQKLSSLFCKIENFWVKHAWLVGLFLGLMTGLLYFFGFIHNIRSITNNIINFANVVIGVTGVFLTLIITLQESPVFRRLKRYFPSLQTSLYYSLRNQIFFSLIVVILSIIIKAAPPTPNKIISSIAVFIWGFFFWIMSVGAFYTVKLVTDLVVRNFDIPKRETRE